VYRKTCRTNGLDKSKRKIIRSIGEKLLETKELTVRKRGWVPLVETLRAREKKEEKDNEDRPMAVRKGKVDTNQQGALERGDEKEGHGGQLGKTSHLRDGRQSVEREEIVVVGNVRAHWNGACK